MFEQILVPTDGRDDMSRVADTALDLAAKAGGTVHALYVVDERAYATVPDDVRENVREALAGDGESATGSIGERAYERGIDAVTDVRWGDPAIEIVRYAVEADIDLIVMGTRGKTGFERYLLGSVAETVVRVSPVPVLTVNLADSEDLLTDIEAVLDG